MKVGDIMAREVITVEPDASILEAARLMLQH
jgi:CBS domain-containing protein